MHSPACDVSDFLVTGESGPDSPRPRDLFLRFCGESSEAGEGPLGTAVPSLKPQRADPPVTGEPGVCGQRTPRRYPFPPGEPVLSPGQAACWSWGGGKCWTIQHVSVSQIPQS